MSTTQHGNVFVLAGNGQYGAVAGDGAIGFIIGSNNSMGDYFSANDTFVIAGHHDSIYQYGGNVGIMTIYGFDGTDSLTIYNRWLGTDGQFLAKGADAEHAMIKPDGHGGSELMFGGGYIHFVGTSEAVIRGDHNIIAGTR